MQLETRNEDGILIVKSLEKRMDAKVAVDFKAEMQKFIAKGNKTIVFDVGDIDFIDSSGLGAIVSAFKLIGRDGELVISGAGKTIMRMFKLTRMDRVFRMFDTAQDAVNALNT